MKGFLHLILPNKKGKMLNALPYSFFTELNDIQNNLVHNNNSKNYI